MHSKLFNNAEEVSEFFGRAFLFRAALLIYIFLTTGVKPISLGCWQYKECG